MQFKQLFCPGITITGSIILTAQKLPIWSPGGCVINGAAGELSPLSDFLMAAPGGRVSGEIAQSWGIVSIIIWLPGGPQEACLEKWRKARN